MMRAATLPAIGPESRRRSWPPLASLPDHGPQPPASREHAQDGALTLALAQWPVAQARRAPGRRSRRSQAAMRPASADPRRRGASVRGLGRRRRCRHPPDPTAQAMRRPRVQCSAPVALPKKAAASRTPNLPTTRLRRPRRRRCAPALGALPPKLVQPSLGAPVEPQAPQAGNRRRLRHRMLPWQTNHK